jgi:small GTP-binding protein
MRYPFATNDVVPSEKLRVLVLGPHCGKSALIQRFIYGYIDPAETITVGYDIYSKSAGIRDELYLLQLFDTTYCERIRPHYFRNKIGIDCAIVCFSLADNSEDTLSHTSFYLKEIRQYGSDIPILLVGTQSDLRTNISAYDQQWDQVADEIGAAAYLECSAKNGDNVNKVFSMACALAKNYRDQQLEHEATHPAFR